MKSSSVGARRVLADSLFHEAGPANAKLQINEEIRLKGGRRMVKGSNVKYTFYWKKGKKSGVVGGVGVISERIVNKVVEFEKYSESVIRMTLAFLYGILNVISAYALQSGLSDLEKEEFWEGLT